MITLLISNEPQLTNYIAKFMNYLSQNLGKTGIALSIIIFTLILKVVLTPFDIWQRISQRRQQVGMRKIKPELDKIQAMYKDDPQKFRLEQKKLFKREKISMFGSFLPLILTMVIFFIVFDGFNKWVRYENEKLLWNMYQYYLNNTNITSQMLAEHYYEGISAFKFLWIKNIFMPDSWASIVPTFKSYAGTGLGAIGAGNVEINLPDYYNFLVGPAVSKAGKSWNGYLVLPLLSIILSVLTSKFLTPQQNQQVAMGPTNKQQEKSQKMMSKMMIYIMPLFIGVLSIFYSAAFSLYLFVNSLYTSIFSLIFTSIYRKRDKKLGIINSKKEVEKEKK